MDIKQYIESGIIEMYVMGLCSREEEIEMEKMRREYPELHEAVIRYEEEMEKNMLLNSSLPGEETDKKILHKLESLATPVVPLQSHRRVAGWWRAAAILAGVLLTGSTVFNYMLYKKTKDQGLAANEKTLPPGDYSIMTNPAITPVALYGVGIHSICRCTMYWDKKTGKAYIMIHHLPESPQQRNYQLWAFVEGKPISVGIINDEIRGRFIEMENVPANAVAFAVTMEKSGGSNSPSEQNVYLRGQI